MRKKIVKKKGNKWVPSLSDWNDAIEKVRRKRDCYLLKGPCAVPALNHDIFPVLRELEAGVRTMRLWYLVWDM